MESATYFGGWCRMREGTRAGFVKWMMKSRQVPVAEALDVLRWGEKSDGWVQIGEQCGWVEASETVKNLPEFAAPNSGVMTMLEFTPWNCDKRCEVHGVSYLGARCPVCFVRYVVSSVGVFHVPRGAT
ncbi:hypothetical protein [Myxococcus eversor]|uniref:hypothetical protein n=1 Tax=Myxococcus eversor TaxID=2709661 RepID=UPI0013D6DCA9|nr:hypothetical protein [Myxococcus eversor]